ncbi:acyl-CoA dehydrogenase [Streptacidiphilus pinicola]|uniref:Acyl-CoA dehydrogenase n=1 Tax=Streptacidiphilus pinicola TaxID=2219663 RepID=A0A2X0IQJ4_9ACTN|nr:acyl-CoA dehydrogenase family protein [Streptacidiphilus pinicola]RAG85823.1 acyl-CoA dehydrogenase [Streptacidiphilus pinicola]
MQFLLDAEQREFARTLDRLLAAGDTPAVVRAWSTGDHGPGRLLWGRLAEAGVFALAVPEKYEGLGLLPVELAAAFVELGRHAVPGPLVETVAAAALLDRLGVAAAAEEWLPHIAAGEARLSLCLPAAGPYALDADAADAVFVVDSEGEGDRLLLTRESGPVQPSVDPARRLSRPVGGSVVARGPEVTEAAAHAAGLAAFATAAQALGVGQALVERTTAYVKQRAQFGVPIGSFQTVKHQLADALLRLEFARPLLFGAALTLEPADVAAAKVACGEAVYAVARTALQLHGAIGYTAEYDLSLWLTKARALRSAWGTPSACRARVLADLG